jgi:hypothetical protein
VSYPRASASTANKYSIASEGLTAAMRLPWLQGGDQRERCLDDGGICAARNRSGSVGEQ